MTLDKLLGVSECHGSGVVWLLSPHCVKVPERVAQSEGEKYCVALGGKALVCVCVVFLCVCPCGVLWGGVTRPLTQPLV